MHVPQPGEQPHQRLVVGVLVGAVALAAVIALALASTGLLMGPVDTAVQGSGGRRSPAGEGVEPRPAAGTTSLRATVVDAARWTNNRTSARVRMTVDITGRGSPFTVTADGMMDGRRGTGLLALDVPGLPETLREIVTPEALYVRSPPVGSEPATWVRTDSGNLLAAGGTSTAADPSAVVGTLRAASDGVAIDGTSRVGGAETVVYVGETDLRVAAEHAPARERRTLTAMLPGVRDVSVPFTAYVDGHGRLRRLDETVSMNDPELGPLVATIRVELSEFGEKVQVEAPGPGKVTEDVSP